MNAADAAGLSKRYGPREIKVLKPDRQVCTARFSPCGTLLAAGGTDATIRRWDLADPAMPELTPLVGHGGWVQAIAFHPDGRRLFSADSWGQLRCWPSLGEGGRPAWTLESAHDGWIRRIALSPDGTLLATCGSDRMVRVWSADDGKTLRELSHDADVFAVAFHPGGGALVSGDLMGVVRHWDLDSGKAVRALDARVLAKLDRLQDVGGVRCLAFDRGGEALACAGTRPKNGGNVQGAPTALLFDWASGVLRRTLTLGGDGDGYVYDLLWHADGFLMAATSGNPGSGKLAFIRPGDDAPFFATTAMANCHSLDAHPDGRRLIVSATNANSNGNGRRIGSGKEYPGNWSPLHVWELPPA